LKEGDEGLMTVTAVLRPLTTREARGEGRSTWHDHKGGRGLPTSDDGHDEVEGSTP